VRIGHDDFAGQRARRVRRASDESAMAPGLHGIPVNDRIDRVGRLDRRVYFHRVQAPGRSLTARFVIVR